MFNVEQIEKSEQLSKDNLHIYTILFEEITGKHKITKREINKINARLERGYYACLSNFGNMHKSLSINDGNRHEFVRFLFTNTLSNIKELISNFASSITLYKQELETIHTQKQALETFAKVEQTAKETLKNLYLQIQNIPAVNCDTSISSQMPATLQLQEIVNVINASVQKVLFEKRFIVVRYKIFGKEYTSTRVIEALPEDIECKTQLEYAALTKLYSSKEHVEVISIDIKG